MLFFLQIVTSDFDNLKKNLLDILIYIFIYRNTSDFKYFILFVI